MLSEKPSTAFFISGLWGQQPDPLSMRLYLSSCVLIQYCNPMCLVSRIAFVSGLPNKRGEGKIPLKEWAFVHPAMKLHSKQITLHFKSAPESLLIRVIIRALSINKLLRKMLLECNVTNCSVQHNQMLICRLKASPVRVGGVWNPRRNSNHWTVGPTLTTGT